MGSVLITDGCDLFGRVLFLFPASVVIIPARRAVNG